MRFTIIFSLPHLSRMPLILLWTSLSKPILAVGKKPSFLKMSPPTLTSPPLLMTHTASPLLKSPQMPPPFDPLVRHLHSQLQAHFVTLRADNVLHPHVTFIVGPPGHPNARYSLHSHLVGCYTSPYGYPSEYHTVLYVPTGSGQAWTGPAEWGPLMVYLAASFLWPDLSFLVVSPSIMLGAHASHKELQQIFDTPPALVLFSSANSIVRDDVLYHPGLPSKFADNPPFDCTDPPFRSFTPTEVATSIADTTNLHLDKSAAWRANIKPHTLEADRQFPLLCTPYYGFVSELSLDTTVALLNIANFLMACCYTPTGTPDDLHNIGDSPPRCQELLALFSCLPSELPTGKIDVYPGTGVFICDPASVPCPTRPTEMCWLYRSSSTPPRPTTHFCSLISTLTPNSSQFCTPLFQDHAPNQPQRTGIPLGEHVCVHLNSGRLPPPFFDRSEKLALLRVDSGGPGSMQYWHSFCPDGPQVPLATVTPATHPLPTAFSSVLLSCEGWAEEDDLFPDPQPTCPSSDDTYLSMWCPDDSPLPSPDHSITICNRHPDSAYPAHGASFVPVDWHQRTPDGRWVWECGHSHTPHCTHLSELFPHLHALWPSFFTDCETDLTTFPDIASTAYLEYVGQPRPGVAAWRFPSHSLATNTLAILFKVFTTPAVLIEGFGAGCSFAAVAGLLALDHTRHPNTRRSSVLLSLGGVAMHPPTFCSLVDAYAFHHSQDAQKYHAYIDEERPELDTRPANFQPTEKTELTYGFLIVQHIHDRKLSLTALLLPLLVYVLPNARSVGLVQSLAPQVCRQQATACQRL